MDDDGDGLKNLFQDRALAFMFVAAATVAIVITTYHLVTVCFCNRWRPRRDDQNSLRLAPQATPTSAERILAAELIPAHKFRKGERDDAVCAVCLSEFEEGEEMRALPGCAHAFHAPCIDIWLFSHLTCPICRADATPSPVMLRSPETPEEVAETRLDIGIVEEDIAMIQSMRSSP